MTKQQQIVTVVGGTGFIGRYVVQSLARAGYTVRVICRNPALSLRVKTAGHVGQVVLQYGDITRPKTLEGKLDGSFAVVNLVGVLKESGRNRFDSVHTEGAKSLASLAASAGVKRFVQISSLTGENPASSYGRTKAAGEAAVFEAFPDAVVLRPSVVFGPEDEFFNRFAAMARISPALPLIGGGKTRFQPVYVVDVAQAVVNSLRPEAKGKVFELVGPRVYSFKEILQYILEVTNRPKTRLASLPFCFAGLAAAFTGWLPGAPLTSDQVKQLRSDSVASKGAKGFAELGITPASVESIVPTYLARYRGKDTTAPVKTDVTA
ncbi:MAG: complex I NDUFA9 subunit family protein [Alphaproteobacteria bacterium]|nr:complex I NDUFA9 subunit family protein [Alphaproteobacteria bacterium]